MMNDPEVYPHMLTAAKKCVVAPVRLYHVLLEPTAAVALALNAPTTSVNHIMSLKPGFSREDVLAELSKELADTKLDVPPGFHGCCFGKVVENDELTAISGWDSSPASHDDVKRPDI